MRAFLLGPVLAAAVAWLAIPPQIRAQSPPSFEVATIRRNASGEQSSRINAQPGGRVTVVNMTLRGLLRNAYGLADSRIVGGPVWVDDDRFDITAKAEGEPTLDRLRPMLQALLVERFKLTLHRENREMPIYALVPVRGDGRLGPALRRSAADCVTARNNAPPPSADPSQPRPMASCGVRVTRGRLGARTAELGQFVGALSSLVERVVVDRTGLTGAFDIDLEWTPDQAPQAGAVAPPATPGDAPSIFTALQEQLGLRLESTRGPVEVLVIERAEKPTED